VSGVTATQLIGLAITVSMAAIVFCVGLDTNRGDIVSLLRKPGLLARSLLAMNVVMPIVAVLLAVGFGLKRPVEVALIALAVSPVPPILPGKEIKSGGTPSYAVALLAISALLAIVFVPALIEILGRIFGYAVHVPVSTVAKAVATSVLVPLLVGVIVRALAPSLAHRISRPLSIIGWVLLIAACVPVLVIAWRPLIEQFGNFTLVAVLLLVLIGLAVGHALGGPDPDDRTALALSTASRHPGVAIAVAHAVMPGDKAVVVAVLFAFLVATIATGPYGKWRKRAHARAATS
jgi:BASS family bile acid:Na+ symporter